MDCRKLTLGLFALILLAVAACTARGDEPAGPECWIPAYCHAVDGDTLGGSIDYPWGVSLKATIRATDYDAWEATRHRRTVEISDEELARGRRARDALAELIDSGTLYVAPDARDLLGKPAGRRDGYGRVLARLLVIRDGERIDVAAWMRRNGHVRTEAAK